MQVVFTVILIKRIGITVQCEFGTADPVPNTSDACAKITVVFLVLPDRIVAQYHINPVAAFIFNKQRLYSRAIVEQFHTQIWRVNCVAADRLTMFCGAKYTFFNFHSHADAPCASSMQNR